MKNDRAPLSFQELPPRARGLADSELSKIFGGCASPGDSCEKNSDCCGEHDVCGTRTFGGPKMCFKGVLV